MGIRSSSRRCGSPNARRWKDSASRWPKRSSLPHASPESGPMAHLHTALIRWQLAGGDFLGKRYSRAHTWTFDGGVVVPASSSPLGVALPMSDAGAVDPEEAFVRSLSSCHMLWFLEIASRAG